MTPDVTAVITTHERPVHVHEALASVRAELAENVEIVVVDDGASFLAPPDGDSLFRVVSGSKLGVGPARNLGLAAAHGEYVVFLDDDDIALPHRIASLRHAARVNGARLCFGMTRRVGAQQALADVPTHLPSPGPIGFCDLLTCTPHINAVLVHTETLRSVNGFDTSADHFDDWSAWLRLADHGVSMCCIADTVAEWRIHPQGLSGQVLQNSAMKARLLSLFERLQPFLSPANAKAVAMASRIVVEADIVTYDDYANAMADVREGLHAARVCLGNRLFSHDVPSEVRVS